MIDKALFHGAVQNLVTLARQPEHMHNSEMLKEVCFALSNVAAGTENHLQFLL